LLIIGFTKGVLQRNIRLAGRSEPVVGKQAVAVGLIFIFGWCLMTSLPFWIEKIARRGP
jgi:hypothetical protein